MTGYLCDQALAGVASLPVRQCGVHAAAGYGRGMGMRAVWRDIGKLSDSVLENLEPSIESVIKCRYRLSESVN